MEGRLLKLKCSESVQLGFITSSTTLSDKGFAPGNVASTPLYIKTFNEIIYFNCRSKIYQFQGDTKVSDGLSYYVGEK